MVNFAFSLVESEEKNVHENNDFHNDWPLPVSVCETCRGFPTMSWIIITENPIPEGFVSMIIGVFFLFSFYLCYFKTS